MTVIERSLVYIENVGRFIDVHNGAVTAIATITIAFFTIVLVLVTGRQARLTRRVANISERALTRLERPFVVVAIEEGGLAMGIQGQLIFNEGHAKWQAINHGRSVALLFDRVTKWPVESIDVLPSVIDPVKQRGPSFPPGCVAGSSGQFSYKETANLMAETDVQTLLADNAWNTHRLFFTGYMRYADLFGGVYVTGFCFVFDFIGNQFVRIGGNERSYTRTEKQPEAA
jgi:hypothetical protein